MSTIKINRARRLADTGNYPRTFDAIINAIPRDIINTLNSKQLAVMVDRMRLQTMIGHAAGYKDAQ